MYMPAVGLLPTISEENSDTREEPDGLQSAGGSQSEQTSNKRVSGWEALAISIP